MSAEQREADLAKANDRDRRDALHELNDIREIAKTAPGKRFLWKELVESGFFTTKIHHSGSQMYVDAGRRIYGETLFWNWIRADHASLFEMQLKNLPGEKKQ